MMDRFLTSFIEGVSEGLKTGGDPKRAQSTLAKYENEIKKHIFDFDKMNGEKKPEKLEKTNDEDLFSDSSEDSNKIEQLETELLKSVIYDTTKRCLLKNTSSSVKKNMKSYKRGILKNKIANFVSDIENDVKFFKTKK